MANKSAVTRLMKELQEITTYPLDNIMVATDDTDIFTWYFMLYGLDGDFAGGKYIGKIVLAQDYPYSSPTIFMLTPNGRFKVNFEKGICASFTNRHPELYNPLWSIENILKGFLSFFLDLNERTDGELRNCSRQDIKDLAKNSIEYNRTKLKDIYEKF